ncbi:Chlorophyll a-b binding protein CP24 10B [Hibiscus syriacus]|uniref:Chlorophyll a-b binding protein, chloroplastic n=1 Tax=Hibiscus syriacus TaxID=106335 RepID=A0A6A3B4P4_HIBSY|nr:Chlorophyll a-b binding protein CP24 10B [Hibiscus syriacus]
MSSTCGAVIINDLGSSFLCVVKRRQALWDARNGAGVVNPATGKTKSVIVAAAPAKRSWFPGVRGGGNLVDPEWLPGDYGFDPLGLGKDPAFLKWYREAELIHGRWAMTAVVGIFIGQAWSDIPWLEAGADPDFFNPQSQSVEWATPWSKSAENFVNATGQHGYPGGKFFDPLGLARTIENGECIPDYENLERLPVAEIKHARIVMLAMLIFYLEAGQGKTPLGALGFCLWRGETMTRGYRFGGGGDSDGGNGSMTVVWFNGDDNNNDSR